MKPLYCLIRLWLIVKDLLKKNRNITGKEATIFKKVSHKKRNVKKTSRIEIQKLIPHENKTSFRQTQKKRKSSKNAKFVSKTGMYFTQDREERRVFIAQL